MKRMTQVGYLATTMIPAGALKIEQRINADGSGW